MLSYVSLYLVERPAFVTRPSSQSVNLTQTATFTCSATGYNVSYQWEIRSGSFPDKVTGINSNTLVIPNVRSSDENFYTCVISNEAGMRRNGARLTVTGNEYDDSVMCWRKCCIDDTGLPVVTVMPSSQSVEVTDTATFTATTTGVGSNNFTYQWRHNETIISGETEDILMITNVMESDSGGYECVVTNQFGDTDTSDVAVLMVTSKLAMVCSLTNDV